MRGPLSERLPGLRQDRRVAVSGSNATVLSAVRCASDRTKCITGMIHGGDDDNTPRRYLHAEKAPQRRIIAVLSGLPVRRLVTLGPAMRDEIFALPPNVRAELCRPHLLAFPHADLVITHGGHGTVITALSFGVPVVCVPMGRDQCDNAARVVWRGAAHALRKGRAQHNCAGPFSMRGKSRDFAKERAGSGRASRAMTDLRSLSTNEKAWHLQWRCAWINPCHPPGRKSHPITPGLPCALSGAASPRPIQPARDGAGEEHRGRQTADWAQDRRTRARTRRHRAAC